MPRGVRQDRSRESKGKHDSEDTREWLMPQEGWGCRAGPEVWLGKVCQLEKSCLGNGKQSVHFCRRTVGKAFGELGLGFESYSGKQMPWPVLVSLSWQPHKAVICICGAWPVPSAEFLGRFHKAVSLFSLSEAANNLPVTLCSADFRVTAEIQLGLEE